MEVDKAIRSMIENGSTYDNIASELGNGLTWSDIYNRWTSLKESSSIIKPFVHGGKQSSITWTAEVNEAIMTRLHWNWAMV